MKNIRRYHTAEFKSKVALEAIREQQTLSQISEKHLLHVNQISDWKKTLVTGSASLFSKKSDSVAQDIDALQAPLLEQIGTLQMEVTFLKKKLKQLAMG